MRNPIFSVYKIYFTTYEPQGQTPSKDSDQTAHSRSLIRIFTGCIWIAKNATFLHAVNEGADQIARLHRLI